MQSAENARPEPEAVIAFFVLRALAALDELQMLGSGRLLAEEIAADRPLETSD